MTQSMMQFSFAGGELSPAMWARLDMAKYHSGAALMKNFFVDYRGGASTRQGTKFINQCKDTTVRLIPFQVSTTDTYVLELGNQYLRAYKNGAAISDLTDTITGITKATTGVLTYTGTDPANGDWMVLSGIGGMTELNGRTVVVTSIDTGAKTFELYDTFGNAIDTSAYGTYTSGGSAKRIQTLATPWLTAELFDIRYVQSADIMTLTHINHAPRELTLSGTFSLSTITFASTQAAPTGLSVTATKPDTARCYGYQATAVDENGQESLATSIVSVDSELLATTGTTPSLHKLSWTAASGALYYNVYCAGPDDGTTFIDTILGFIGQASGVAFTNNNIAPDFSRTPPQNTNPFASSNNPSCVTYDQQRRVFAGSASGPQTLWFSQPGYPYNFNKSLVVLDTDAITITIASREVNTIQNLVSMPTGLMAFTTSGAFLISGQSPQAAITPLTISALPQASNGANNLPPIVVNYDVLYVERTGNVVRDAAFNFYTQSYYGYDRSALASHLFFNYQIVDWAYAAEPFRIIWCIRNDGAALSFTYVPEQEVYGWAQHNTTGSFTSVCSVVENTVDAVYFAVTRTINGTDYTYLERLAERNWTDVTNAWCLDCALSLTSGTAFTTVSGLYHLVGQTVTALADGNVISDLTVAADGTVTLPQPTNTVIVGLPFTAQLQTLYTVRPGDDGSSQSKRQMIPMVTARVVDTRGLKFGQNFTNLVEYKPPFPTPVNPPPLRTEDQLVRIRGQWVRGTQICIQQDYPLPATVTGLMVDVVPGDTGR